MEHNRYKVFTYGCQMNESDSLRMGTQLEQLGYKSTENLEDATIILINTCCVRESAEKKIHGKIGEIKNLKRKNPEIILGVVGCMAQKEGEKLFRKAPHIDFVLGTNKIHELNNVINDIKMSRHHMTNLAPDDGGMPQEVLPPTSDALSVWVPITYGCNNFCTYCIVPYVRGREHSRPMSAIIDEVQNYSKTGVKEVTLLGQNVNSYGKELTDTSFAKLLYELDKIDGIERVRYMTSHPRDLSDEVIDVIRNSRHICSHFHLPVQHGSDRILKAMNRGYTIENYRNLIKKVRTAVPDCSLTTDIIVGFPGETDEDFKDMLEFIKEMRYDAAYTFLYSKRSGTPAATMENQVEEKVKKERLNKLMAVQNEISLEINKKLEGSVVEVMVEGPSRTDEAVYTGRTSNNKIVLWEKRGQEQAGDLVQVKINHAQTWVLKGDAIYG
ncbi:tRNA (N6-isopentenyl adenosine(37)-C2)-methylthiotransferase MiaB [Pectinatus brassicae]|uniref:tRNA-2-methylthio-N(6)-dimethylallyladenosine synthase n=1 Tax=Pectinatus brassicae TaxID=862415 RepID=A0A840UGG0_9FIRM|nr:tRNA (N6-isopentenyl adenosine(37)-C2)-methylthiotransferase MiaB [Pectinatus brassicae]MBB5336099.1 tRNA-2-methylthio-N6-dimethylallyladenosine synthase [Pectinatus brassicae]